MSKPDEIIMLRVPVGCLKDGLTAVDFGTIASQSPEAVDLIQEPADAPSTWHPSQVTAEIGVSTRVIEMGYLREALIPRFDAILRKMFLGFDDTPADEFDSENADLAEAVIAVLKEGVGGHDG